MLSELKTKLHSLFGSDFISQVEQNFETIKSWADKKITSTKTMLQIKNAHKSSQIKHTIKSGQDVNLQDHERYQDEQITNLVLGHNGDGVQELRASRTSMDAQNFDDLSNRLYHDFYVRITKEKSYVPNCSKRYNVL